MGNSIEVRDINLYNRARDSVHTPVVDGLPLYKRVNNANGGEYRSSDFSHDNDTKTDKWKAASENTYNSPRNIRRIFLGENKTVVHFYKPIKRTTSGGNLNTSCVNQTSFSTKISIEDFVNSLRGKASEARVRIKGEKTGISAMNDWSIKNIEEIYVDWTGVATRAYAEVVLKIQGLHGISSSNIVKSIFYTELGIMAGNDSNNMPNWRKKFPRLKVVGLVRNLDQAYEQSNFKPGTDSIEDMLRTWCDEPLVRQMAAEGLCGIAIHRFRSENMTTPEKEFSCDSGLYVFDRDILEPYAADLKRRIGRNSLEMGTAGINSSSQEKAKEKVTQKGVLELAYDTIYKYSISPDREIENLNNVLLANDRDELLEIVNGFTDEGKAKYFKGEGLV